MILQHLFLAVIASVFAASNQNEIAQTLPPKIAATNTQQTNGAMAATTEKVDPETKDNAAAKTEEPAHDPEGVKPPEGFQWELWAKEPLVADPVAFTVLNDGSLMVVESERQDRARRCARSRREALR